MVHRSPAQWASPVVVAIGLTVSVEKLASLLANISHPNANPLLAQVSDPILGGGAFDMRRPSTCSPDVLVCSGASGLNAQGVVDRLLVASHLWGRGIKADYLLQDVWGQKVAAGVDLSVEQMTIICLSLSIPYLVIVKAHTLKEKQSVKVRSVLDPSEQDQLVPLSDLVAHLQSRLGTGESGRDLVLSPSESRGAAPYSTPAHHFYQHHHQHHAPGTAMDLAMTYLLSHGAGVGPGDKKRAFKEQSALERKVKSHLEAMFGHTAPSTQKDPLRVVVVELPYCVMRELATAFLLHGRDSTEVEEVLRENGAYNKKVMKHLLETIRAIEAEDLLGKGVASGKKGGASSTLSVSSSSAAWAAKIVFLYSTIDDCIDILPLYVAASARRSSNQHPLRGNSGSSRPGLPKR